MLSHTHRLAHATTLPSYQAASGGSCSSVCDELRLYVRRALGCLSSRERAMLARYFDSSMVGGRDRARARMAADLGITIDELHARMDVLRQRVADLVEDYAYAARR